MNTEYRKGFFHALILSILGLLFFMVNYQKELKTGETRKLNGVKITYPENQKEKNTIEVKKAEITRNNKGSFVDLEIESRDIGTAFINIPVPPINYKNELELSLMPYYDFRGGYGVFAGFGYTRFYGRFGFGLKLTFDLISPKIGMDISAKYRF